MKPAPPKPSTGISTVHAPSLDLPFRFLAMAVVVLVGLALSYPWTLPTLAGAFYSAERIAFVHMNTLGWLVPIVVGAGYQLVPVVMQTHLFSVRLGRLSGWIFWSSLALFLAGWLLPWSPGIALGGMGLLTALSLYAANVLVTVWRSDRRDFITWHVAVATLFLAAAAAVGALMALNRWLVLLGGANLRLLSAHAALMLAGWLGLIVHGVAFRLVGMFTLSEDLVSPRLAWAGLACTGLGALGLALAWPLSTWVLALGGAGLLGLGALAFDWQLVRMYTGRRRRTFDVHIPFALLSALWELAALGLLCGALIVRADLASPLWKLAVWLGIVGWAGTMEQGMMYKIGTFLTWLHRYAPVAGRQPVPRLDQLYSLPTALAGWALWGLGVLISALGIWMGSPSVLLLAGIGMAAGALAFGSNMAVVGTHWLWRRAPLPRASRRPG